jgi:copper resistance protein B
MCTAALALALALPVPSAADAEEPAGEVAMREMSWSPEVFVFAEVLEFAPITSERRVQYDVVGWAGGAWNRIWVKADGHQSTRSLEGDAELQLLFGRLVLPFWDAQVGVRLIFLSTRGEFLASLTAAYDVLLTQRLVAQGRLETQGGFQAVREFGYGTGVHHVDLGLRVRYEIVREFAPYVGVSWERLLMQTAAFARADGDPVSELSFVVGLRVWY